MKITLKSTILFSASVAAALNVGQFFSTYQQREAATIPGWAQAASEDAAVKVAATAPSQAITVSTKSAPATAAPIIAPLSNTDAIAERLAATGLKPGYAALYLAVQQRTGTPWQLLAAVHEVETGQSGNTTRTSYAGATGPMQFMPATFAHYAADGNGDGAADIHNLDDAMLTAGRYLDAGGAGRGDYTTALYHYNHSWSYVSKVLGIARRLGL